MVALKPLLLSLDEPQIATSAPQRGEIELCKAQLCIITPGPFRGSLSFAASSMVG